MKKINSEEQLVANILENKQKTLSARFQPLGCEVEKVKDVLNECMEFLAHEFSTHGFRYSKNKKMISRNKGGFRHEITLQSDSTNLSGEHIGVGFQVSVTNTAFKKWEVDTFGYGSTGCLFASQIGNMSNELSVLKWELVSPETRRSEFESIAFQIRNHVLPYFEHFSSKESFHELLKSRDFNVLHETFAPAHAVWIEDKPLAEGIIKGILIKNSEKIEDMHQFISEYKNDGIPDCIFAGDHAKCWAKDSIILGLFGTTSV